MTEAGANLVDTVAMPKPVQDAVAAFVAEHHVEEVFVKRKRDRANPEAMARRGPPVFYAIERQEQLEGMALRAAELAAIAGQDGSDGDVTFLIERQDLIVEDGHCRHQHV